jgi:hypothetical protein
MLIFYTLNNYTPAAIFNSGAIAFGGLEVFSIAIFFYNMLATLLQGEQH